MERFVPAYGTPLFLVQDTFFLEKLEHFFLVSGTSFFSCPGISFLSRLPVHLFVSSTILQGKGCLKNNTSRYWVSQEQFFNLLGVSRPILQVAWCLKYNSSSCLVSHHFVSSTKLQLAWCLKNNTTRY